MLQELHPQALRIAGLLRERGEKIAVADGATGGLIAASLLTVPGALDFFVGGGVVYSFRARDVLFDLPREAYKGMQGASEDYALLQARVQRLVFGVREPRSGAVVSLIDSLTLPGQTHRIAIEEGVHAERAEALMQSFFRARR